MLPISTSPISVASQLRALRPGKVCAKRASLLTLWTTSLVMLARMVLHSSPMMRSPTPRCSSDVRLLNPDRSVLSTST